MRMTRRFIPAVLLLAFTLGAAGLAGAVTTSTSMDPCSGLTVGQSRLVGDGLCTKAPVGGYWRFEDSSGNTLFEINEDGTATVPGSSGGSSEWYQADKGLGFGNSLQPFITDFWLGSDFQSFRILEQQQAGKGMLDIRNIFNQDTRNTNVSGAKIVSTSKDNQHGPVNGLTIYTNHEGDATLAKDALDTTFNMGVAVRNTAHNLLNQSVPARLHGFFGIVGTPQHDSWGAVGMELNIANHHADLGERLESQDWKPYSRYSHLLGLKPETEFFGPNRSMEGHSIDMYIYAGPDLHSEKLVGAYGGLIFRNDAFGAGGFGVRLGGRTSAFPDAPPDTGLRIDKEWDQGIDFREGNFNSGAINLGGGLQQGQTIQWHTSAGLVRLWASPQGELMVRTPGGGSRVLAQ